MAFRFNYKDNRGQALSEYALIIALIAIVVIGVLSRFGGSIKNAFNTAGNAIDESISNSNK